MRGSSMKIPTIESIRRMSPMSSRMATIVPSTAASSP